MRHQKRFEGVGTCNVNASAVEFVDVLLVLIFVQSRRASVLSSNTRARGGRQSVQ
jgi:hypothetical protein